MQVTHLSTEDWHDKLMMALNNPSHLGMNSHLKHVMRNYVVIDEELFQKGDDDVLL